MNLTLQSGQWRADLRPKVGGALAGLWYGETPVLRAMAAEAEDALQSACFPLVPYCNRIRDGRFIFADRAVVLAPNLLPEPHSLHGLGWRRPWVVASLSADSARLRDDYIGGEGWPWLYRAEQTVELDSDGCTLRLTVTNLANDPMPAGLGLHPYFRRRPETRVQFTAQSLAVCDSELLPTGAMLPADTLAMWNNGCLLPRETVDHCHAGWQGTVRIEDDLGSITMTATSAPHLHVYAPADGSALCFEPVSHLPDAPNQNPGSMALLAPGEDMVLEMRITAA